MILKSVLIWLLIIPFAILNGILRESVLNTILGDKIALPISGIILSVIIFLIAFFLIPRLKINSLKTSCYIGLIWVAMTVIFEFGMGFSTGQEFSDMLAAYNPLTGNLWLLAVITTGVAPWLIMKIKSHNR